MPCSLPHLLSAPATIPETLATTFKNPNTATVSNRATTAVNCALLFLLCQRRTATLNLCTPHQRHPSSIIFANSKHRETEPIHYHLPPSCISPPASIITSGLLVLLLPCS
ncbi:hypothetical protein PIB30_098158 [Stylosanthes scabra]|uniref:Uncharacterized protein n=1 Tax=Stylosanthes scabra TaxID=79078 RepID=A0ABU6TW66_9FABA|nr:hypothetical protein [Stylosanthes scabra]